MIRDDPACPGENPIYIASISKGSVVEGKLKVNFAMLMMMMILMKSIIVIIEQHWLTGERLHSESEQHWLSRRWPFNGCFLSPRSWKLCFPCCKTETCGEEVKNSIIHKRQEWMVVGKPLSHWYWHRQTYFSVLIIYHRAYSIITISTSLSRPGIKQSCISLRNEEGKTMA